MSRGRWEEMVNAIGAQLEKLPKASKKEAKAEKKPSIEDIPGDPGSTVGKLREYKKKQEQELSDL